ncbi:transposase [Alteribacillus sp. HJP-4]|uniref:transposase n=1 Tax=Alteribacillus sp. HJP-4 TaxID=2775394 RepID=UPI0035CCDF0E
MGEQRQRYSEKFKKETVRFVQEQRQKKSMTDIAEELHLPSSCLYEWMKLYREFEHEPVTSEERFRQMEQELHKKERELQKKEREIDDYKEQLAIVKKAVHVFSNQKS